MEWISVKERLPEDSFQTVIGITYNPSIVGSLHIIMPLTSLGEGAFIVYNDTTLRSVAVTHWMPLPAPPHPTDTGK